MTFFLSLPFSDSDDEMEMRLKEAAVSVKDLLPSLVLSPPSMESPCSVKMTKTKKKDTEGEESRVKKKKKKNQNQEDGEQVDSDSTPDAQSNGELTNSEQEHMQVKVKRKKKKKRQEENAEEEALHWFLIIFLNDFLPRWIQRFKIFLFKSWDWSLLCH